MPGQTKKNKKNLIIGICAAVVAIIIIVVIIVAVTKGNKLDDSYFVTDDTKYVLTLNEGDIALEYPEFNPEVARYVYYRSGDTISGMKAFYKYSDNQKASEAAKFIEENYAETNEYEKVEVNGQYVVMTMMPAYYQDLTPSDVEDQIELVEYLKNLDLDDYDIEPDEEEETESEEEEVED